MGKGGLLPGMSHTRLAVICYSGFCSLAVVLAERRPGLSCGVPVVLWESGWLSGVTCTCRCKYEE